MPKIHKANSNGTLQVTIPKKVAEAIKERYEMFIRNKTNKAQYKLIGMELTVWTSGNTYKHFIIPVDD